MADDDDDWMEDGYAPPPLTPADRSAVLARPGNADTTAATADTAAAAFAVGEFPPKLGTLDAQATIRPARGSGGKNWPPVAWRLKCLCFCLRPAAHST